MADNKNELKIKLDSNSDFQKYLYPRGYLVTTNSNLNLTNYPFYDNWECTCYGNYYFYISKNQNVYFYESNDSVYFLIGHAYNPFSMLSDEKDILNEINNNQKDLYESINELTGNFLFGKIDDNGIFFLSDASCMLTCFYGCCEGDLYLSQYSQLIGDICNLDKDSYVDKLLNYRFYSLFGKMLPGDMSAYNNFKHTIPNFSYYFNKKEKTFSHKRFYTLENKATEKNIDEAEYKKIIDDASKILHNNLVLIAQKWNKPAISLTGGCDSKTTLSCANGIYDKFNYYSYTSSPEEDVDAKAANEICEILGQKHKTDFIDNDDSKYDNLSLWKMIFENNCGNIGKNNSNDIRKRIYYCKNESFDVEVKSWVSEIARAYFQKRFDNYKFPKEPTPRLLSAMYKVFFLTPELLKATDKNFRLFLNEYYSDYDFSKAIWTDLLFWEYRISSWNGLVISNEQSVSYDITIPYNNRILLDSLLKTPLEYRATDKCHKDIQKKMNSKIADAGISVTNVKHTSKRAKLEKLYLFEKTLLHGGR